MMHKDLQWIRTEPVSLDLWWSGVLLSRRNQANCHGEHYRRAEIVDHLQLVRNSFDRLRRIGLLLALLCVPTTLVFCDDTFALPFDPKWGVDTERSSTSLENRRGPDPIHRLAPINPGVGLPGGRLEADGGASAGNYQLAIPLIELPGRGMGLSVVTFYNSQIWSQRGSQRGRLDFEIDSDGDWPVPGWNLGFGKLVFPYGGMLIEPDGTRRPLAPPDYEFVDGRYTGRVTAKFTDGSSGSVECPRGSDGCNRPGHIVKVTLTNGRYAEFFTKETRWSDTNVYYPQRIWDAHGNFIK